jgi:hypothetical protein
MLLRHCGEWFARNACVIASQQGHGVLLGMKPQISWQEQDLNIHS